MLKTDALICEYLINPRGIDTSAPRLGWMLASDERAQNQSAYHILVPSRIEDQDADRGALWDTGRPSHHISPSSSLNAEAMPCFTPLAQEHTTSL